MAAPSQHPQLPIFLRASVARVQEAEVEALKKQVEELQMQLKVAKKVEEVADAMQRLEGMAMQSASTTSKGQAEVKARLSRGCRRRRRRRRC
jgi:hypothetical protein